jgi:hypothetical protein
VDFALLEAAALLLAADREPELDQVHAAAHQVALELRRLAHEFQVFLLVAESHHPLDAGTVVPGAVEQGDLASRGQVLHVALEVPLATFGLAGLLQRHHVGAARIEVLHEAFDGAALAGGVAAFEQDHHLLPGLLDPGLQLEQFDLQAVFLPLVALARHQVLVGVGALAPVVRQFVVRIDSQGLADFRTSHERIAQGGRILGGGASEDGFQRLDQFRAAAAGLIEDVVHRDDFRFLRGLDRLVDDERLDSLAAMCGGNISLRCNSGFVVLAGCRRTSGLGSGGGRELGSQNASFHQSRMERIKVRSIGSHGWIELNMIAKKRLSKKTPRSY